MSYTTGVNVVEFECRDLNPMFLISNAAIDTGCFW